MTDLKELLGDLKGMKKVLMKKRVFDLVSEAVHLLNEIAPESDELCYAVMLLHKLVPDAPMPEGMYKMLKEHGHDPQVRIVSKEEQMALALAMENGCDCPDCQALRAKYKAAHGQEPNQKPAVKADTGHLVTAGSNTVH